MRQTAFFITFGRVFSVKQCHCQSDGGGGYSGRNHETVAETAENLCLGFGCWRKGFFAKVSAF